MCRPPAPRFGALLLQPCRTFSISMRGSPPRAWTSPHRPRGLEPYGLDRKGILVAGNIVHRSRSRHDPQRGQVQHPAGVPQQRPPAPFPPPATVPPGDWRIAPDATPFRNFCTASTTSIATPHRGEPPVRAKSARVERARPASSSGSEVPPSVWFTGNTPPRGPWLSGPPGSWRPQPPRPVVPPPGFLSESLRANQMPPKASGEEPSSTPNISMSSLMLLQ